MSEIVTATSSSMLNSATHSAATHSAATHSAATLSSCELLTRFPSEEKATQWFENQRWPQGKVICPNCSAENDIHSLTSKQYTHWCRDCEKHFNVRTNSMLDDNTLPLRTWLMAIYLMQVSSNGISAFQLSRELAVTPPTAWFLMRRIRGACANRGAKIKPQAHVGADKTYVDGMPINQHAHQQNASGRNIGRRPVRIAPSPIIGARRISGKLAAIGIEGTTQTRHNFTPDTAESSAATCAEHHRYYVRIADA